MPIPVHADEYAEYVLKSERNKDGSPIEGAAVFFLGSVNTVKFHNMITKINAMKADGGNGDLAVVNDALKEGLRGWRWKSPRRGTDVPFLKDAAGQPSDETLNQIPFGDALELMHEIIAGAKVTASEAKNSDSE